MTHTVKQCGFNNYCLYTLWTQLTHNCILCSLYSPALIILMKWPRSSACLLTRATRPTSNGSETLSLSKDGLMDEWTSWWMDGFKKWSETSETVFYYSHQKYILYQDTLETLFISVMLLPAAQDQDWQEKSRPPSGTLCSEIIKTKM